ncbi:endonuclease/exonuclease/phosphatase family protein [Phenylobacterium sp.]|uniref:endonuclease/exonuclease/phosphatase family protein n=1 Tax=Phenylobacterium sp. TaxID=1871053 RepID=UPI0025E47813|nr:endonuclease/exonuclease/phosphatase family protein [Phenylobacterium sp.]
MLLRYAALAAGALAAVGGMLAQGGRFSPLLDMLTHFAPIYAGLAIAALLAAGLGGRPRRAALVLAMVGLGASAALLAPEYLRPAEPAAPASAPGQLKVIQFNAYKRNADIGRVADWLIAQNPDIVTLQEARHDLRDLLLRRTGWSVAGAHEHVMIFSRAKRIGMRRPPLGPTAFTYLSATFASASGPYEVITTHLDWPNGRFFQGQHADLARLTAQIPRRRMILTGDLNTTPWSFTLRRTDRALGLARRDRALWSYPARLGRWDWPLPVLPIDHIYAGPGWRVVSLTRGPNLGSDHYPLVIVLAPVAPR